MILLSIFLTSCGGGKKSQANFSLKAGALVNGPPLDGGVFLRAIDSNGVIVDYDILSEHSALIPFGTWSLHFVGYGGASPWTGTTYCGSEANVVLESEEANIVVNLDQANCGLEPYVTMINDKQAATVALWDTAIWDSSLWGP